MTSVLADLYGALHTKYQRDRGLTVHVSDIAICSLESYYRRIQPPAIDNTQLGFFVFGESAGSAIQALVQSDPARWKAEHEVKLGELQAHIDLYDAKNNIPIEIKTANIADMDQPKPHYVSQLKMYMAMTRATTGIILVMLTQHFKSKRKAGPFREWIITLDELQIAQERARISDLTKQFKQALEEKNPIELSNVLGNEDLNWKCNHCQFKRECQDLEAAKK